MVVEQRAQGPQLGAGGKKVYFASIYKIAPSLSPHVSLSRAHTSLAATPRWSAHSSTANPHRCLFSNGRNRWHVCRNSPGTPLPRSGANLSTRRTLLPGPENEFFHFVYLLERVLRLGAQPSHFNSTLLDVAQTSLGLGGERLLALQGCAESGDSLCFVVLKCQRQPGRPGALEIKQSLRCNPRESEGIL